MGNTSGSEVKKAVLRISKSPSLFVVPSTNENEYSRTLQHTMSFPARASGSPTELLFVKSEQKTT